MRFPLAAAFTLLASPALAQQPPQCFDPVQLIEQLSHQYGESPIATGETSEQKALFVVFASKDGATWTLVLRAERVACIIASGQNWQDSPFRPRERGT